jgi:hypothetical protein
MTFGFAIFSMYMRYILTPISALTWANLNHTLCGIDNDPWRVLFGMHKYFYFWADGYLSLTSHALNLVNVMASRIIHKILFSAEKNISISETTKK